VYLLYVIRLCVTKENSRRVELYSVHSNPFKSFEFCVAGRDHFVRFVHCSSVSFNTLAFYKFCLITMHKHAGCK